MFSSSVCSELAVFPSWFIPLCTFDDEVLPRSLPTISSSALVLAPPVDGRLRRWLKLLLYREGAGLGELAADLIGSASASFGDVRGDTDVCIGTPGLRASTSAARGELLLVEATLEGEGGTAACSAGTEVEYAGILKG